MRGSLLAASPNYGLLAWNLLADVPGWDNHATVIIDIPTGYALEQLDRMTIRQRRASIIITPARHPAYHDILASYYARYVAPADNDTALAVMRAIIKDDAYTPSYQPRTGITYDQAQILAQLLLGRTTEDIATARHTTARTVRNHISAVFARLGMSSRVELITELLTGPTKQESAAEAAA